MDILWRTMEKAGDGESKEETSVAVEMGKAVRRTTESREVIIGEEDEFGVVSHSTRGASEWDAQIVRAWDMVTREDAGVSTPAEPVVPEVDVGNFPSIEGAPPFFRAIYLSNRSTCKFLVETSRIDVNATREDMGGLCALHWAAKAGNLDGVTMLLKKGANVNAEDDRCRTPLHIASLTQGGEAVVQALIEAGANPRAKDENGTTCFMLAALAGLPATLKVLLEAVKSKRRSIVDAQTTKEGFTALMMAGLGLPKYGNELERAQVVQLLLQAKATPNVADRKGYTALMWIVLVTGSSKIATRELLMNSDPLLKAKGGVSALTLARMHHPSSQLLRDLSSITRSGAGAEKEKIVSKLKDNFDSPPAMLSFGELESRLRAESGLDGSGKELGSGMLSRGVVESSAEGYGMDDGGESKGKEGPSPPLRSWLASLPMDYSEFAPALEAAHIMTVEDFRKCGNDWLLKSLGMRKPGHRRLLLAYLRKHNLSSYTTTIGS